MLDEVYCMTPDLTQGHGEAMFYCNARQHVDLSYIITDIVDFRGCNVALRYGDLTGEISIRTENVTCVLSRAPKPIVLICRPELEELISALKNIVGGYGALGWYGLSEKEAQRAEALLRL